MKLIFFAIACVGLGSSIRGLIEAIYQKKEKQRQQAQHEADMVEFDRYVQEYYVLYGFSTKESIYLKRGERNPNPKNYTCSDILKEYLAAKNNLSS